MDTLTVLIIVGIALAVFGGTIYYKNRNKKEFDADTGKPESVGNEDVEIDEVQFDPEERFLNIEDSEIPCQGTLLSDDRLDTVEDVAHLANNSSLQEEVDGIGQTYEERIEKWLEENYYM